CVIDESVGLGLARHHLVQAAVDILYDEIDGIGRQASVREENIEHALVGMDRCRLIEMAVITAIERGAERDQSVSREHDGDRDANGLEQHAEAARLHLFLAAGDPPPPGLRWPLCRNLSDKLSDRVLGMCHDGGALAFRHVVQHLFWSLWSLILSSVSPR